MENDKKKNGKGRILIILGVLLLLVCGAFAGYSMLNQNKGSGGTSLGTYTGKTNEEIQAELDKQMLDSMMTISLDTTPTLSNDGKKLEVRVVNVEENKFQQMIVVEQDGKVIGSYKGLKPGETLDYIDVKNCKIGHATVTIQRLDDETDKPSGNASSFEVEVVQ